MVRLIKAIERDLLDTLSDTLESFFRSDMPWISREVYTVPPVNVRAFDDRYEVEVALPGFGKKDITLQLKDNVLILKGERKEKEEEKEGRVLRQEFRLLKFQRAFVLPEDVDPDEIEARFENGVLTVKLPKRKEEEAEGKVIDIK